MPRGRGGGRGGKRNGRQGESYPNRTDLNKQPVRVATGQTYGEAGQQAVAQQAVPLPQTRAVTPGEAPGNIEQMLAAATPLDAPSARPEEPVTEGLTGGMGRGPEALDSLINTDPTLDELKGIYMKFPNEDLRIMISQIERRKNV